MSLAAILLMASNERRPLALPANAIDMKRHYQNCAHAAVIRIGGSDDLLRRTNLVSDYSRSLWFRLPLAQASRRKRIWALAVNLGDVSQHKYAQLNSIALSSVNAS